MDGKKRIIFIACSGLLVSLVFLYVANRKVSIPVVTNSPVVKIQSIPNFVLSDINGVPFILSAYKNRPMIINFWATWCGPCKAEIPGLIALYAKYESKGLVMLGASMDDSVTEVKAFVDAYKINYPIVMAPPSLGKDFGGVYAIPATFILNKKHQIVKKIMGYETPEELEKLILEVL